MEDLLKELLEEIKKLNENLVAFNISNNFIKLEPYKPNMNPPPIAMYAASPDYYKANVIHYLKTNEV
jgi:hypothetical protein